ncbi:TPA: ATP-binding protein [Vibrio diabolicus]|uniref:sensor histidine kinase n=1 Tax=Vibrio alginolyticus TaxID=663 RepID=UPI002022BCB5|nr:sensor histidine kinase [Vibrio alginolyticus]
MGLHSLKFAPPILARLGEELLPSFDQGIIELVRNAYDADATECIVRLSGVKEPGGTITISDNGNGMDEDMIAEGWLVLGNSSKRGADTTKRGRTQVGDKGLGRLAALRMGKTTSLISRPQHKPNFQYSNTLTWSDFDEKSTVDEVGIRVDSTELDVDVKWVKGTDITISNLHRRISKPEAEKLARSLMLLSNPFSDTGDFTLKLQCEDYPDLEKLVNKGYLEEAEYIIKATLHEDGRASAVVYDWKGDIEWETTSSDWFYKKKDTNPIYDAPSSTFELSIFQLENKSFTTKNINVTQVRQWLKAVGGVHIYHNKFRVHPYGDQGSDWLDMNLARVNMPIRPSTNTSIGKVEVTDPDKRLQQKTDRMGFIESEAFIELKRFITDALNWYARKRTAQVEKKKKAEQSRDAIEVKEKSKQLDEAISLISDQATKTKVKVALRAANTASKKHTQHLKEDLKLYRSLATAGTTTAVFSHEVSKPLDEIPIILDSANKIVANNCDANIYSKYTRRTKNIFGYLDRLSHFAKLQLDLLKKSKRRNGVINVNETLSELIANFTPLLKRERIDIESTIEESVSAKLHGSVCILEAIITNCFTNSMRAFQTEGFFVDRRKLELKTYLDEKKLIIAIHDNGPGIIDVSLDDIWLPGFTTNINGTGFGLTIVKDSVSDLGGYHRVEASGPLGGASFYFEFEIL